MADIFDLSSLIRRDENVETLHEVDGNRDDVSDETLDDTVHSDVTLEPTRDGLLDFGPDRAVRGALRRIDPTLDWSNQELADLYRVQRLLGQAGIGVDTDRGVTDEGDPWFVFLDAHGEVFVHLSRIDAVYFLDSAVQDQVVTGQCFATLIERFAGRAEAAAAIRPDGQTVISMNRRGKIVMHPGAALAALIWTILMATDELVFLEEAIPSQVSDGEAKLPSDVERAETDDTEADVHLADFEALFEDREDAADFLEEAKAAREHEDKGTPVEFREGAQSAAQAANALALTGMGLTALAAAYGINRPKAAESSLAEEADSEVALSDTEGSPSATDTNAVNVSPEKDLVAQQAAAGKIFSEQGQEMAAEAEKVDVQQSGTVSDEALTGEVQAKAELTDAPNGVVATEADAGEFAEAHAIPASHSKNENDRADQTEIADDRDPSAEGDAPVRLSLVLESVGLEDLLATGEMPVAVSRYHDIGSSDDFFRVLVGADLARSANPNAFFGDGDSSLGDGIGEPSLAEVVTPASAEVPEAAFRFEEFNTDVRDYIDHLILNSEVEIITFENQILVIDSRALVESGEEAFALSWSLDDDVVVSTIGVKSDFEAFDLIA